MLKASIIGNLGNDPEMRYSANGAPLLRFSVASNFRVRTPEGEWQDRVEWVRVAITGNRAESLAEHLRKGNRVYVDGRLEARPWIDEQRQARVGLEMLADAVEFMSPRQDDQAGPAQPARPMSERVAAGVSAGRDERRPLEDDDDMDGLPF